MKTGPQGLVFLCFVQLYLTNSLFFGRLKCLYGLAVEHYITFLEEGETNG